ncbi:TetR/AcrR family transcriptional regulator [Ruania zhangjianzhongii]|uniref:TetR/AcrR family transcriptional regulator n=1 Tax=Ruania zhangjianzhongii TaxID=2603206 RepID=UPI001F446FB3|nr:TetR/AcrR family transcriptional regulator [Ruania zhangjianzhongii]
MTDAPTDRRAALKERSRQAIVQAAAELMDSTGGTAFTVDELAERADVSRRTVFNHFASLDDVVAEVCADVLGELIQKLATPIETGRPAAGSSILDELAAVVRSTDLVTPMAYLTRTLGGTDPHGPWHANLLNQALTEVGNGLVAALRRRYPEADTLDLQLLASSFTGGVLVLHTHWWERTGAADDQVSRVVWAELLDHLIEQLRTGFGTR